MSDSASVKAMNHIATILIDGSRLYDQAADTADDPHVRNMLEALATERRAMLADLEAPVKARGGEPAEHGSPLGAGHRAFLGARAAVQDDDDSALGEVDRGEEYLLDELRKAAADGEVDAEIRALLGDLIARAEPGHARVHAAAHAGSSR